jgi:uncharacterized protein YcsI (UPF0317 family)
MRREDLKGLRPGEIRSLIREGRWREHTGGLAEGYVQANLVVLPKALAFDFLAFCQRNPQPCPVLEVTDVGVPKLKYMAKDADLRTDLPMYKVWENGECVADVENVLDCWNDDLVAFLLGCSASLDWALVKAGVRLRHMEQDMLPCAYISNIQCEPAGIFHGPMVVTMRSILKDEVARAFQITSRYPAVHGAPVHVGDPRQIGINNLDDVDFGERTLLSQLEPDEVPVFWACGATPQVVALEAKPEFMISHFPGCMFITDVPLEEIGVL